jgi:hypothetical protein
MEHLFLSYAHEDRGVVGEVYRALRETNLNPWMDAPPDPWGAEGIPIGAEWDTYVRAKIEGAKLALVFLSTVSVVKSSYVQRELRFALECMESRPPGRPYLFPIRLDECEVPSLKVNTIRLRDYQWFDLFTHRVDGLVESIRALLDKPEPGISRLNAAVAASARIVVENESRRFNEYFEEHLGNKDREISRLREELAYANKRIPPAEVFHDPYYMEWWQRHRFDEDG